MRARDLVSEPDSLVGSMKIRQSAVTKLGHQGEIWWIAGHAGTGNPVLDDVECLHHYPGDPEPRLAFTCTALDRQLPNFVIHIIGTMLDNSSAAEKVVVKVNCDHERLLISPAD